MTNDLTLKEDNSLLSPKNFEHAYRMANMICQSALVPKAYFNKPQDVLIAMEMGRALNLSPLSAVQNIAVINGRPSLYGDGVLAVCSGHREFEDIKENRIMGQDGKICGYECSVKRKGRTEVNRKFTIEDAKTANLWGKQGPWTSYPERMLQMRARGFALRDSFADALGGVRIAEEVMDYEIDITPNKQKFDIKEVLKDVINKNKSIIIEASTEQNQTDTLNSRKVSDDINNSSQVHDIKTKNTHDSEKADEVYDVDEMGEIRSNQGGLSNGNPQDKPATLDQLTDIRDLMADRKLSKEGKIKILAQFNVEAVEKLSLTEAEILTKQLSGK